MCAGALGRNKQLLGTEKNDQIQQNLQRETKTKMKSNTHTLNAPRYMK